MATRGKDRQTREQRERARTYQARRELYARQERRRRRDNVIGVVVGLVVILGAVGLQIAYFVSGPGMPLPEPTATATPSPADAPSTDAPTTPLPSESAVPSESTAP